VRGRIGVELVGQRQLSEVRLVVQLATVEVVQVRILDRPLEDDA
jgi:hypothetical protein